jgi:hypothetical protein
MTTLAWFIFAFTLLQFVVAIVNLIFSQKFQYRIPVLTTSFRY